VAGDTKADTKLVKKLAPSLSVKHATTAGSATALANVTYVKGNVVDAPANGGSGVNESGESTAERPAGTVVIGSAAHTGGPIGEEINLLGIHESGTPGVDAYFDNFTNTDAPGNYAIAICAAASTTTMQGFAQHSASSR
jgi:hypothetical protein